MWRPKRWLSFLCFTEEADGGLVLGSPTTLPAAQLLSCGSPLSAVTSHWPIFISFCSLLPFSLAGAFTFSPPKLLLLVFFLIHYCYLFLRSQLLCDLLHRVRCFHTRLFWPPMPVLGRTHSAVGSLLQGALWRGGLHPLSLQVTLHMAHAQEMWPELNEI